MTLCYDFQKWTMITLASVAISLTIGLVSLAYGQVANPTPGEKPLTEADIQSLVNSASIYKSPYLVIIDGSGTFSPYVGIILDHYIKNGFEIKAIQGTTIFMQIK